MTKEEAYYILSLIVNGEPVTKLAMKEAARIAIKSMDELEDLKNEINGVISTVESWKKR